MDWDLPKGSSCIKQKKGFRARELPELFNPKAFARKKVIVIAGPTGIGKTTLSILIAKALGGEVVSADSMQVYRGMDIGTAKPSLDQRREVIHHLVDSRDLDETFNVMEYYQEASLALREILDKGGVPLVVGGSGFYLHSLLYGPPSGPASDPSIRKKIEEEMELFGVEAMFQRLQTLDPDYAKSITENDRHKIVRALEIITLSSKPVSFFAEPSVSPMQTYDFRCWFLHSSRENLYAAIEKRCDEMLRMGFIEEVERLEKQGLCTNQTASQAIGYKQCIDYLASQRSPADLERFIQLFKQASRRYAKRQFTWFRRADLFRWLSRDEFSLEQISEIILQDYERG